MVRIHPRERFLSPLHKRYYMSRTILVTGEKKFQIEIPDDAELTFGPELTE